MKSRGSLFLIPSTLGPTGSVDAISQEVVNTIHKVDFILAENPKTTRAFLKRIPLKKTIQEFDIRRYDKHHSDEEDSMYIEIMEKGLSVGIISEAGCPGIADPGGSLVRKAHQRSILVRPISGPSSFLLALMASGLNGQQFSFVGYLPKERTARIAAINSLTVNTRQTGTTFIIMETPYHASSLFHELVVHLPPDILLCVAADLTMPTEFIATKAADEWKTTNHSPDLSDRQVVFLVCRQ